MDESQAMQGNSGIIEHPTRRTLFSMRPVCYTWVSLKPCKVTRKNNFKIIENHYSQRIVLDQVL